VKSVNNDTPRAHAGGVPFFDLDLIRKYDKAGPRYTSYPTAPMFHESIDTSAYEATLRQASTRDAPLSLYVHIPFCDTVCYYCGCFKIVTKKREFSPPYLDHLEMEIKRVASLIGNKRPVSQLHWGGGTPTFLNDDEIRRLFGLLRSNFNLLGDDRGEYSIEIDPRECGPETIRTLRKVGFNRLSMGVQDIDPEVQKAVNRIQPIETTRRVVNEAREAGFFSVSIDLMYGLPLQTMERFDRTLDQVIEIAPDRIALFNYAHLPHMFMPQRRINIHDIPAPEVKLAILEHSIRKLLAAGYVFIGMDHFAKPDDEMAVALREGKLQRNFQGYSTHADADMIGFGVSSIGFIEGNYFQNDKELEPYYSRLERGELPIHRGYRLTSEDHLRRFVIMRMMCDFSLDFGLVERTFNLNFAEHFAAELNDLLPMQADGLLTLSANGLVVEPKGRLLIRNIAMVFDEHLRKKDKELRFSKTI